MIGFNFLGLTPTRVSGIGRYSVSLFEAVVTALGDQASELVTAFVPIGNEEHFSGAAKKCLTSLRMPSGAIGRIAYEQTGFVLALRRAKVKTLLNAAFTGPLWGGVDMVTVMHDLFYKVVPEMVRPDRRLFLRIVTPLTLRKSRAIVASSTNTALDLARHYPDLVDRINVVPLACRDLGLARSSKPSLAATDRVMMVSTITANKNPDVFVAAIKLARDTQPWATGVIVGNDPEGLAAAAVANHDAAAIVELRSHVSDSELADLYSSALAVVVPSFYEGFGLPVLEAQAAGAPVICSDRGSLPEVAGDAAMYFAPDRADQLAESIIAIRHDPDRRQRMIDAGRKNVTRFSWERTARETMAVIAGVR